MEPQEFEVLTRDEAIIMVQNLELDEIGLTLSYQSEGIGELLLDMLWSSSNSKDGKNDFLESD